MKFALKYIIWVEVSKKRLTAVPKKEEGDVGMMTIPFFHRLSPLFSLLFFHLGLSVCLINVNCINVKRQYNAAKQTIVGINHGEYS